MQSSPRQLRDTHLALCTAVIAFLYACYPDPSSNFDQPPRVTECGLSLPGGSEDDLARLQRQERITLDALEQVQTDIRWTKEITCPLLAGATVQVKPLADGGTWTSDELFFHLPDEFDRGSYDDPLAVVVTTKDWSSPEFSWQLVRIITRGAGSPDDLLFETETAIADAAKAGRDPGVDPLPPLLSGATGSTR